jgi:general secretion pathway protein G
MKVESLTPSPLPLRGRGATRDRIAATIAKARAHGVLRPIAPRLRATIAKARARGVLRPIAPRLRATIAKARAHGVLRPIAPRPRSGRGEGVRALGFTLIELMVVMVLIALLLTIAVPRYFSTIDTGKASVQRQNISAIRDAIDKYFGDLGKYPETLQDLVDKKYLRSIPVDPITGKTDWAVIAPTDPNLTGVYDIRSSAKPADAGGTNANGS